MSNPDLSHFSGIVPCGVSDHGVTSLVDLGLPVTMADRPGPEGRLPGSVRAVTERAAINSTEWSRADGIGRTSRCRLLPAAGARAISSFAYMRSRRPTSSTPNRRAAPDVRRSPPRGRWSSPPIRLRPRPGSKRCARRQRGGRTGGGANGARTGRAAIVGSRRRGVPRLVRRRHQKSQPSTRARPRLPKRRPTFPRPGRQAARLLRRGRRRPFGRRARRPRLLETVHRRYGKRPWASLFDRRSGLAEQGFAVSPRLASSIAEDKGRLDEQPSTRAYFFDAAGAPLGAGHRSPTPPTPRRCGRSPQAVPMHSTAAGSLRASSRRCATHPTNPGCSRRTTSPPIASRNGGRLCALSRLSTSAAWDRPPPARSPIGQILGMLEPFDLAMLGPDDPESWRLIGDATRLAFADRERYLADSDFVSIPKGLLDPAYLQSRAHCCGGRPPWAKRRQGRRARMGQGRTQDRRPLDGNSRRPRISSSSTPPATSPR